MKKFISIILTITTLATVLLCFAGCEENGTLADTNNTREVVENLQANQPTPTDINYSLERYNLIKRAYWVNGQREKAMALPCAITKPLGYIVLFTDNGAIVGSFVVDGKVSSLNSFLTSSYVYYSKDGTAYDVPKELADVDGSYGENDAGIFFFTTDGKYIEWTGTYLYSDIPFIVDDPIVKVGN
jgi:hypothetical protein